MNDERSSMIETHEMYPLEFGHTATISDPQIGIIETDPLRVPLRSHMY